MTWIKKNKFLAAVLAVMALLFFLHWTGLARGLERTMLSAVQPLAGRLYSWSTGISRSYEDRREVADFQAELRRLETEVAALTVQNSRFQELAEENVKLRKSLSFQSSQEFSAVVASVIAREEAGGDARDLIINRGGDDGLRPGLGVVTEDGVMVGKVVEVKDRTSKICLVTTPGCRLAALVQNQPKTQGLTDGDLGLTIKMNYIPQLEKIALNDLIITSGLSGDMPRGFVIGRVTKVVSESNEVWQEATIEPLVNFNNLTIVNVIVP